MSIVNIQNFSYHHPDRELLFKNISLQINTNQKVALVGQNGCGKTSLLHAIVESERYGEISLSAPPYLIPQQMEHDEEQTIASTLQVEHKVNALKSILNGQTEQSLYDTLADDWQIETKVELALTYWGIGHLDPNTLMGKLSGGERVKVFLAGIQLHKPSFVILDEPTNHLDYKGRELLYNWVKESKTTLLIVSHDAYLLNLVNTICELNATGINLYSGNYDFYLEQREREQTALLNQLEAQQQELAKLERTQQKVGERRQRIEARGAKATAKRSLPRIIANARKSASNRTTASINKRHTEKNSRVSSSINQLKSKLNTSAKLQLKLEEAHLHRGKVLVRAHELNFSYAKEPLWQKGLSTTILSGERILIKGSNGSGKTSFIKLINQDLLPSHGELYLAEVESLYLDQNYSLVNLNKSVYEQASSYNHLMPEHEVKMHLARSQFPSSTWHKACSSLSGGEKMKLALCSLIISKEIPNLLILDEPTNNLDLDSLMVLTNTVKSYQGTLLVISHDKTFISEVGIERVVNLDDLS